MPKKTVKLLVRKDEDSPLEILDLLGCCCVDCDQPASIALWWTTEENVYCLEHARGWIKVGWAMAHYLPQQTARLLTREEMLMEDPCLSLKILNRVDEQLKLHHYLWGNHGSIQE